MENLIEAWAYYIQNQAAFWQAAEEHLLLTSAAMGISLLIGLPTGIWIAHRNKIAQATINGFNALRVIPSLAVLFLVLPYLGLGFVPSLVALSFLALTPVLINTYAGLRGVDGAIKEAASGMGLSAAQVLLQIEIPLAVPAIVTGIRIAAVEVISSATLASFIGGGGLGDFITRGFALYDVPIMLVGAIPVALLALLSESFWSVFLRFYAGYAR
jgi:osmoprotectant transport system permease protein